MTLSPRGRRQHNAQMSRGRTLLERRLQPFLRRHGLHADWHSDRLLRLEPHAGSGSARAVIDLATGFWEAFDAVSERVQERVVEELMMRLAGPYVASRQGEAHVVVGSLNLIEAASQALQKRVGTSAPDAAS